MEEKHTVSTGYPVIGLYYPSFPAPSYTIVRIAKEAQEEYSHVKQKNNVK